MEILAKKKRLSFAKANLLHEQMWEMIRRWIEEGDEHSVEQLKLRAVVKLGYSLNLPGLCFLCAYDDQSSQETCDLCPRIWPEHEGASTCLSMYSPFNKILNTSNKQERLRYATMIRDLPVRETSSKYRKRKEDHHD